MCFIVSDRNIDSFDGDLFYAKRDEDRICWLLFSFFIFFVKSAGDSIPTLTLDVFFCTSLKTNQ
jgi:hypothetical protein